MKKYAVLVLAGAFLVGATACTQVPQAEGEWGYPDSDGQPSLLLETDGSLSGTDGCNRLIGTWSQEGSTVSFHRVASTRMACQGVDEWLKDASTAQVSGDSLVVFNSQDSEIGQLPRVK